MGLVHSIQFQLCFAPSTKYLPHGNASCGKEAHLNDS